MKLDAGAVGILCKFAYILCSSTLLFRFVYRLRQRSDRENSVRCVDNIWRYLTLLRFVEVDSFMAQRRTPLLKHYFASVCWEKPIESSRVQESMPQLPLTCNRLDNGNAGASNPTCLQNLHQKCSVITCPSFARGQMKWAALWIVEVARSNSISRSFGGSKEHARDEQHHTEVTLALNILLGGSQGDIHLSVSKQPCFL